MKTLHTITLATILATPAAISMQAAHAQQRPPLEPKCSDLEQAPPASSGPEFAEVERCWSTLTNHPGCYFWLRYGTEGSTYTWSGSCPDGIAEGDGILTEEMHPRLRRSVEHEGTLLKGRWHGTVAQTTYHPNGQSEMQWMVYDEHGEFAESQ